MGAAVGTFVGMGAVVGTNVGGGGGVIQTELQKNAVHDSPLPFVGAL